MFLDGHGTLIMDLDKTGTYANLFEFMRVNLFDKRHYFLVNSVLVPALLFVILKTVLDLLSHNFVDSFTEQYVERGYTGG